MSARVCALAVASLLGIAAAAGSAGAHTATPGNLGLFTKGDDSFRNYDFLSPNVRSDNVDWAVNLLFTGNAEVDKVKDSIGYGPFGGPMYARFNGGPETGHLFVWDSDRGTKSDWCPITGDAFHMRVYADGDDRLYNKSWGYWVLSTAHIDHAECGADTWFGLNEAAENHFAGRAKAKWGKSRVLKNNLWLNNKEAFRRDGYAYWLNDGWATRVLVP